MTTIIAPKKNYTINAPGKKYATAFVIDTNNLVDEDANQLVDESGNLLVAETLTSEYAYELVAPKKNYTINAPERT